MGGMKFHGGGLLGFDMRSSQLSSELDLVFSKMPTLEFFTHTHN